MRLTRVDIEAFGCLRDLRCEIAPGLHVFHGPNEAGKSTFQQAVLALLYNFYEGDRARKVENDARERYAPWSGGAYAARLEYELEGGRRYRVFRDFRSDEVPTQVWDTVTGNEVTGEFGRGRHGNVPFMLKHLGMTRRVFEACAFVSQGELFEVAGEGRASPQEIGETVVRLADTAGRDVSANMAINRLGKVLEERVGGQRARAKPLAIAQAALSRFRAELEAIDLVRKEVEEDAAELKQLEAEAAEAEGHLGRSRYLLAESELNELSGRLKRLAELDADVGRAKAQETESAGWASFPAEERDDVRRIWNTIGDLRKRLEGEEGGVEEARARSAALLAERDTLLARERELAHVRSYPVDSEMAVNRLLAAWRGACAVEEAACQRLAAAEQQASPWLDEHGRLEAEVGALTAADVERLTACLRAPETRRSPLLVRAVAGAVAWFWRSVLGVARWVLRRGRRLDGSAADIRTGGETGPGIRLEVTTDEAAGILQRHRRFLEISPDVRKYREEVLSVDAAARVTGEAAAALRGALSGLVEDASDLEAAHAVFTRRLGEHRELQTLTSRLASIERELSVAADGVTKNETERGRLAATETALTTRLEAALGRSGMLAEMVEAFEEGCRGKLAFEAARKGLRDTEERRGILLSGRSPQEIQQAVTALGQRLREMAAADPGLSGARTGQRYDDLKSEVSRRESDLQEMRLKANRLATAIDTRLEGLRSRSEVEEEIARAEQEATELESFGDALKAARDAIGEAMKETHRNFAPHVGQFLSSGLARVTAGRYEKAYLDPSTLAVTAEVPETGLIKSVETLSRGTRAAAYLLLRAGLAQHMSSLSEPVPLILDDPLVDLDDVRVQNFLELLLALSEGVQVLLFTKDAATAQWLERTCAGDSRHRVTLMERAGTVAPVLP